MKSYFLLAALALMAAPSGHALERVAAVPYGGASSVNTELQLPSCTAGQVLTSLGSNTFSCIGVNESTTSITDGGDTSVGLPNCSADQALAVTDGKFVCANIVKSAPKCENGFALVGDGKQTLSCVQASAPVSCGAGQALTSDQGQFECVTLKTPPTCGKGQALTASGGEFSCMTFSATNCNGRITQNWGGYQYCSSISCASGQALTLHDGYPVCAEIVQKGVVGGAECITREGDGISYKTRSAWGMADSCRNISLTCKNSTPILTGMYHDEMPEFEFEEHFGYKSKLGTHVKKFICWK